jgi:hypothetical protein
MLCPLRYVASIAFVMESIVAFAERGHRVDVLVSDVCDPTFECNHSNVRSFIFHDTSAKRGLHYFSFFKAAYQLARTMRYDLTIGISQVGLIVTAWIKKLFGIPCVFYNDEIWFGDERHTLHGNAFGYAMKFLERHANRQVLFTVTQDPTRGRFLAKINRIPMETLRYIPNSRAGQAGISKSKYMHKLLEFPCEAKIVLWMGALQPNDGALELACEAQDWPDDYRMVFHFRTEHPSPYMLSLLEYHGKGQTYISNKVIPYREVDRLVASATIGLGIYADKGINARYICSSSGKINAFLRKGVPCIVKNYEGLRWVEDLGVGLCVNNTSGVFEAVKKIVDNYETYQKRTIETFESLLSFDNAFAPIAEEIEKSVRGAEVNV